MPKFESDAGIGQKGAFCKGLDKICRVHLIGVIAKEFEKEIAMEFFQLFKTPWEFFQENRRYDVVIVATDKLPSIDTGLTLFYNSNPTLFDSEEALEPKVSSKNNPFEYQNLSFPI